MQLVPCAWYECSLICSSLPRCCTSVYTISHFILTLSSWNLKQLLVSDCNTLLVVLRNLIVKKNRLCLIILVCLSFHMWKLRSCSSEVWQRQCHKKQCISKWSSHLLEVMLTVSRVCFVYELMSFDTAIQPKVHWVHFITVLHVLLGCNET